MNSTASPCCRISRKFWFPIRYGRKSSTDAFLTDDTAARLAARQLSLPVHGTIGILVRAIRRGQSTQDEVLAILRRLPVVSTLHIRRSFLAEIIEQIERASADS